MSNNPAGAAKTAIAVGDKTVMFVGPLEGTTNRLVTGASDRYAFSHAAEDYVLLHVDTESQSDLNITPLSRFLEQARFSPADRGAFLLQIFGATQIIAQDATTVDTLFNLVPNLEAQPGLAILHRISGVETSVLVHSRDLETSGKSVVFLGNSSSLERVFVTQHARFVVQRQPKLRLTVVELSPGIVPDRILVIAENGVSLLRVETAASSSLEAFFHRYSAELPDALQLLYQSCRPLRAKFSELFARQKLPSAMSDPAWSFHLRIDSAFQLANGYFLAGWYADPEDRLAEFVVLDHRLEEPDVLDGWQLTEEVWDQDGKRALAKRFRAFVPGSLGGDPLFIRLQVSLRGGIHQLLTGPKVSYDTTRVRDAVLATIEDRTFSLELFRAVYGPALGPIQNKLNARQDVRSRHTFGTASKRQVSVIIPLYAQLGFMRTQLMAFVNDPYIRESCQIVYVLDDPRLVYEAKILLEGYQTWIDLDIELVVLDRNGGYAMANNCGASVAAGEYVVLLNSDVIAADPGWIEAAMAELGRLPEFSVVGPKLLYADTSLQHAGMFFERFPHGFWQNLHYWKGFGRDFEPAHARRIVPAVTGACMVLRKSEFLDVDGFTSDYISGDYEDSDLCLKLRQRGGQCVYIPEIELYHFERQSMPKIGDGHDRRSTIYNRALHTDRWNDVISTLMAEFV